MIWLVLGVVLWVGAHFFKRLAPDIRKSMGKMGRAVVSVLILAGLVSLIVGFRSAPYIHLYALPDWVWHLNNLLMLAALFFADAGRGAGIVRSKIRHPMLWGGVLWAVAHLLVNGDLASVVLFGGIGLWAIGQMWLINRVEGPWVAPAAGTAAKDVKAAVIAVVLFAAIVGAHYWFGFSVLAVMR